MNNERQYWRSLIDDLQGHITLEHIAAEVGVSERQVSNWKTGDRPRGMNAINLYLLHVKLCTVVQGTAVHGNSHMKD